MKHVRFKVLLCSALLFLSATTSAQEVEEEAPPPPPPPPELTEEEKGWQRRFERADGFRFKMMQTRVGVELYYAFLRKNHEDVQANRLKCLDDMRRANRDTKFSTLQACYRKELLLHHELSEKQKQYVENIPGVSEALRSQALTSLSALSDALDSVREGTENNVFQAKEELIEAKKNLHAVYRVPVLRNLMRVEIDRMSTWVAHLMHRLLTMTQNTDLSTDAFSKAAEALLCFAESEGELTTIGLTNEFKDENKKMRTAVKNLQACADVLRESHTLQDLFENPPEEEVEDRSKYSPRRRWSG
tara:strand:- start:197 stop:1102 length:906 start_codon:yes stop_codon:yes gene_type:complete